MDIITFECKVITPMFLHGADGKTPELRAPSIKGAMRFWWRACNGHLSLVELKKAEDAIFGSTSGRSCFGIRVVEKEMIKTSAKMLPHKTDYPAVKSNLGIGSEFNLIFTVFKELEVFTTDQLKKLFILVSALGGLGKRNRRGAGNFIVDEISCNGINEVIGNSFTDIRNIVDLLKFPQEANEVETSNVDDSKVPSIEEITKITSTYSTVEKLRYFLNEGTHEIKKKHGRSYSNYIGSEQDRLASTVIFSIQEGDKPFVIATRLRIIDANGNIQKSTKAIKLQKALIEEVKKQLNPE